MQVWFIGRTLASQAGETGSTPATCLKEITAVLRKVAVVSFFYHGKEKIKKEKQRENQYLHGKECWL